MRRIGLPPTRISAWKNHDTHRFLSCFTFRVTVSAGLPDELAGRMHDLWTHPDMCVAMGEAARDHVELDYSPERYYQLIMGVYEEVVHAHSQ